MKKPQNLNSTELKQIGKIEGECYKFDLSRISNEKFENLLKTINTIGVNKATGFGFNTDLLTKTNQRAQHTEKNGTRGDKLAQKKLHQLPVALSSSVILRKKSAIRDLCSQISKILPKSETLEFLKLRSIPIKVADVELLSQGIFESGTLRTLRFCDVPLGDDGFERLARALRKQSVINLQLRKCKLTDESGQAMRSLLFYHSYVQNEVEWRDSLSKKNAGRHQTPVLCLSNLDLQDNEFTFQYIESIQDPLIDLRIVKVLDLRGNAGISSTVVSNLVKSIPDTTVLTGPSKPIKSPKPQPKLFKSPTYSKSSLSISSPNGSPQSPKSLKEQRLQALETENERLKLLIECLQTGNNVVQLEPGLNIVGPRAAELVDHIVKLDDLLARAQDGPPSFLSSSRGNSSNEFKSPGKRRATPKKV
ncbi:hypothetical protein TRFO_13444 [Tritrichomonas foetus]|uniref:Leucine Rich Repeat family protein n=1 Tax=Tritrichomonas foetus TaxID=1144522 RepID=A0A1J4L2E9_9EUKA|nr:hypothetical protein TRFO_13444 [Tritrichomonas foetus]|eukprot:OHT16118.1 hypothetical protein TRFO_13444 [Tritrichomonas foetus]